MRLSSTFYQRDAVTLAKDLLGKHIVRHFESGNTITLTINETEAYCGEEDLGCHASKGRTQRTEVMYHQGGEVYVYLIYGMYWLLNIVCAPTNSPQAVLIRGTKEISGPGRLGKKLLLDQSFYGENLLLSKRIWIEESNEKIQSINESPRIGIDYAGDIWSQKPWRFTY